MHGKRRTIDVTTGAASFDELLLPNFLLQGLAAAGFTKPSPVQTTAIPLARVGADLIVQAKSGTGKTLVYGISAIEGVKLENAMPQALVLVPTREIALQVAGVLSAITALLPAPGLVVGTFIGGLPIEDDQKLLRRRCHIAVGTPGRLCALLEMGSLQPSALKLLVLDEADQLLTESFNDDIRWIHEVLPKRKQMLALSATYTPALLTQLEELMNEPRQVLLCPETVSLVGVRQFYSRAPDDLEGEPLMEAKIQSLLLLLARLSFHQAVVFCNSRPDAEYLAEQLVLHGMPAAFLAGGQPQAERMSTLAAVRDFRLRVIVSTDLVARGVDLARVNLVANLDLPRDGATYMHRVGRTGRYGTRGIAVTFANSTELARLQEDLQDIAGGQVEELPDVIPEELYAAELESPEEQQAFQQLLESQPEPATEDYQAEDAGGSHQEQAYLETTTTTYGGMYAADEPSLNGEPAVRTKGVVLPAPVSATSSFGSWWPDTGGGFLGATMAALRPPPPAETDSQAAGRHVQPVAAAHAQTAAIAAQSVASAEVIPGTEPSTAFGSWWDQTPMEAQPTLGAPSGEAASSQVAIDKGLTTDRDEGAAAGFETPPEERGVEDVSSVAVQSGDGYVSVPEALLQRYHELEAWAQSYEHWNWSYQQWQSGYQEWGSAYQQYRTQALPPAPPVYVAPKL